MRTLNEMKVADAMLRAQIARHSVASAEIAREAAPALSALAEIAAELGEAPHLFREDAVLRIASIITAAADMEDLYDEEPRR